LEVVKHIKRGIVVLTKIDLVDEEWLALASEDVRTRLEDSAFAGAPLLPVSAATGAGLEQLKATIAQQCAELEQHVFSSSGVGQAALRRPFRLAIDRAFTVSGFGTVVTGSASAGSITEGDTVEVWRPNAAAAATCRVRGIEVHGSPAQLAEQGERTALNLAGIDLEATIRGGTVAAPGALQATKVIDTHLDVLPEARHDIRDGAALRLHLGTIEVGARVLLFDVARLRAGESSYARLRLDNPLVCARGDRFVVRDISSERVLGGGIVLEPQAVRQRAVARQELPAIKAALDESDPVAVAAALLLQQGAAGLTEAQLGAELQLLDLAPVLAALKRQDLLWQQGNVLLYASVVEVLKNQILAVLGAYHQKEPLQALMPREALRAALPRTMSVSTFDALLHELTSRQTIGVEPTGARLSDHRVTLDDEAAKMQERLEKIAHEAAWQPLTVPELLERFPDRQTAGKLYQALIQNSKLVRVGDFVLSRQRVDEGTARLRRHFEQHPSLSVADAREILNTTRKWAVPLLEYYDRIGVTRRDGEVRLLR
jgi:selenocysteine-specific elongation factor